MQFRSHNTQWRILGIVVVCATLCVCLAVPSCGILDCVRHNKSAFFRLKANADTDIEIWCDCAFEISSPVSYTVSSRSTGRGPFCDFGDIINTEDLRRISLIVLPSNSINMIAVIDTAAPSEILILLDLDSMQSFPPIQYTGSEDQLLTGRRMLSQFTSCERESTFVLAVDCRESKSVIKH